MSAKSNKALIKLKKKGECTYMLVEAIGRVKCIVFIFVIGRTFHHEKHQDSEFAIQTPQSIANFANQIGINCSL